MQDILETIFSAERTEVRIFITFAPPFMLLGCYSFFENVLPTFDATTISSFLLIYLLVLVAILLIGPLTLVFPTLLSILFFIDHKTLLKHPFLSKRFFREVFFIVAYCSFIIIVNQFIYYWSYPEDVEHPLLLRETLIGICFLAANLWYLLNFCVSKAALISSLALYIIVYYSIACALSGVISISLYWSHLFSALFAGFISYRFAQNLTLKVLFTLFFKKAFKEMRELLKNIRRTEKERLPSALYREFMAGGRLKGQVKEKQWILLNKVYLICMLFLLFFVYNYATMPSLGVPASFWEYLQLRKLPPTDMAYLCMTFVLGLFFSRRVFLYIVTDIDVYKKEASNLYFNLLLGVNLILLVAVFMTLATVETPTLKVVQAVFRHLDMGGGVKVQLFERSEASFSDMKIAGRYIEGKLKLRISDEWLIEPSKIKIYTVDELRNDPSVLTTFKDIPPYSTNLIIVDQKESEERNCLRGMRNKAKNIQRNLLAGNTEGKRELQDIRREITLSRKRSFELKGAHNHIRVLNSHIMAVSFSNLKE